MKKKKKLNFKIILAIIIAIIVFVGIIGYYLLNSISKEPAEIDTSYKYIADEKNEEITSLIGYLKPKLNSSLKSLDGLENNTFEDWIESIRKLKNDNLFAQKAIEIFDKTNYYDLEEYEKMYLDYYIKDNFFSSYSSWNFDEEYNINVVEAYTISFESENPCYLSELYLKQGASSSFTRVLLYKTADGSKKCITSISIDKSSISNGKELYYVNEDNIATVKSVDVDMLNNLIVEYKELIDFMRDYSEEYYLPIMEDEYKQEKADREAKQEEKKREEELKKSIPKVGMTSAEVKKTKWGEPDKINKDTYSWGTSEQWVYNGRGYVYFKNGVVTSVSER